MSGISVLALEMGEHRIDHVAGHHILWHVARDDRYIGLGIDGITVLDQFLEGSPGIGSLEERAVGTAGDPLEQDIGLSLEPDRYRLRLHQRPRIGMNEGAATGGEDNALLLEHPGNDAGFPGAEFGFTALFEDFRDGHLRRPLDLLVAVAELAAQTIG